jgi:hypothetical protein
MKPRTRETSRNTDLASKTQNRFFKELFLIMKTIRKDYGEKRFLSVGILDDVVVVVAYTFRGNKTRIISIRRANRNERKTYQERSKEIQIL